MSLNERQKEFCRQYILDFNGGAAYRRAGYKPRSEEAAYSCAHKLLRNAEVQTYLSQLIGARSERTEITIDRVLQEYASVGFAKLPDVATVQDGALRIKEFKNLPETTQAAIERVKITENYNAETGNTTTSHEVRMHGKLTALGKIGKYLGMDMDLNLARATFRRYGYTEVVTETGFSYTDSYVESSGSLDVRDRPIPEATDDSSELSQSEGAGTEES